MKDNREKLIDNLWKEIHGDFAPVFYWLNHTHTWYHYDPEKDAIVSDNGFSVKVDAPTEQISKKYIIRLIDKLEIQIADFYYDNYQIEL